MSKSAGKKPKEKSDKTKADNFVWTDDEVQLLLEVTNDYKVSKAAKIMLAIMLEISASMTQLNTRVYAILETHSIKETGADI